MTYGTRRAFLSSAPQNAISSRAPSCVVRLKSMSNTKLPSE